PVLAQIKKSRREVAELMKAEKLEAAFVRVEKVVKEEMMGQAWERLELYLHAVEGRAQQLTQEEVVPSDLTAAVSSILYAALRLPEFEQLQKLKALFARQYTLKFVNQVTEAEGLARWEVNKDLIHWLR
ncbi:uncharacterized protein HaLaN_32474, partial [Haematococcus lacustris]